MGVLRVRRAAVLVVLTEDDDDVTYLLRDEFTTAESAPLDSPRDCEPGPGTLTITDAGDGISISDGELIIVGSNSWGDEYVFGDERARQVGMTVAQRLTWVNSTGGRVWVGWYKSPNSLQAGNLAVATHGGDKIYARYSAESDSPEIYTVVADTDYIVANILRSDGRFILIQDAGWKLLWLDTVDSTATLYPGMEVRKGTKRTDRWRVFQLSSPWDTDYGIATERLAGSRSAGDTFAHEADCLIEFQVDALPTNAADIIDVRFRIQDATNYWQLTVNGDGDLELNEIVSGASTTRGSDAGNVAAGDRVVIISDDETIRIYEDNNLRITYSSAANFKTETAGEFEAIAAGGAVSDIVTWPRTLSGSALSELEKYTS
jgi:ethanolamine utilization microcompartment shell protein EutL